MARRRVLSLALWLFYFNGFHIIYVRIDNNNSYKSEIIVRFSVSYF